MIDEVINDFENEYPVYSLHWIDCVQIRIVNIYSSILSYNLNMY
jgi:hypothetical protein